MHRQSFDVVVRTGIKTHVDRAVRIQAPDLAAWKVASAAAPEESQFSANYDFAISLHYDTKDCAVFRLSPPATRTGIKASVNRAVGIQSRDAAARDRAAAAATASSEISSDQNLAVRLQRNSGDSIIRTGIKGHVERPIGIQPCDTVTHERTGAAAESRKTSSNQYFPICL